MIKFSTRILKVKEGLTLKYMWFTDKNSRFTVLNTYLKNI